LIHWIAEEVVVSRGLSGCSVVFIERSSIWGLIASRKNPHMHICFILSIFDDDV
jgi:hypothetical protein